MSVLATVVPSATPVVQHVVTVVQTQAAVATPAPWQPLVDEFNKLVTLLSPYVVLIGAAVASFVQALLNKLPWLASDIAKVQDLKRKLLAVGLPLLGTFLAGLATGQNVLHLAAPIFLVSQILYAALKALQASGAASSAPSSLATETPAQG